jgi:hypothetical protein
MISVRPDVRDFFQRYQSAGEQLDTEALASFFSGVFMSLDPNSATAVSPQALLAALPRRRQLFQAIGSDGLELADISEIPLDDLHTLVRTSWRLGMRNQASRDPIFLLSTFILRREDGAWRIVLYLNHQDLNKLFSELGDDGGGESGPRDELRRSAGWWTSPAWARCSADAPTGCRAGRRSGSGSPPRSRATRCCWFSANRPRR